MASWPLASGLSEHCATLLHNLKFPARARYARRVLNAQLDPRYVPMLARDLEQQADVLADSVDDALNDPKQTLDGDRSAAASLGIAFYVFESAAEEVPDTTATKTERSGAIRARRERARPKRRASNRGSSE